MGEDGVNGALGEDGQSGPVSVEGEPEAATRLAGAGHHAPEALFAGLRRGAEDLGAGGVPAGVVADEDGVVPVIGVEQAAAVADFEYVGAEGALPGEGVTDPGPDAESEPWQPQGPRGGLADGGLPPPRVRAEEAEGVREAASRRMDDEIDGGTP